MLVWPVSHDPWLSPQGLLLTHNWSVLSLRPSNWSWPGSMTPDRKAANKVGILLLTHGHGYVQLISTYTSASFRLWTEHHGLVAGSCLYPQISQRLCWSCPQYQSPAVKESLRMPFLWQLLQAWTTEVLGQLFLFEKFPVRWWCKLECCYYISRAFPWLTILAVSAPP
jgi:hypothetical protein